MLESTAEAKEADTKQIIEQKVMTIVLHVMKESPVRTQERVFEKVTFNQEMKKWNWINIGKEHCAQSPMGKESPVSDLKGFL